MTIKEKLIQDNDNMMEIIANYFIIQSTSYISSETGSNFPDFMSVVVGKYKENRTRRVTGSCAKFQLC